MSVAVLIPEFRVLCLPFLDVHVADLYPFGLERKDITISNVSSFNEQLYIAFPVNSAFDVEASLAVFSLTESADQSIDSMVVSSSARRVLPC